MPIPGTNILPEDAIPFEKTDAESSWLAVRNFIYDYCTTSANPDLSRGYLSGLERMVRRLGPGSDMAKACCAVGMASHGKPLNRPSLVRKAERLNQELLVSMAGSIEGLSKENADEFRALV